MKKQGLTIAGVTALTIGMMSFVMNEDNDKKKKYQIIQQKDGQVFEYDTLVPSSSKYTVEDFITEKGIDVKEVEIIQIPSISHSVNGEEVIVNQISTGDAKWTEENETLKIIAEQDDNGELKVQKFVNGEEVEVSEEDIQQIQMHSKGEQIKMDVRVGTDEDGVHMTEKDVQVFVEMGEDGEVKIRTLVNGEKVEVSEDEMKQFQLNDGDIKVFMADTKGVSDEEIRIVEMLENIEGDEQKKVIVKIETEESVVSNDKSKKEQNVSIKQDVKVSGTNDFVIALVMDGYIEGMDNKINLRSNKKMDNVNVHPNPNNGIFTVSVEQEKQSNAKITVVDWNGKTVYTEDLGKIKGKYSKEINLKKFGAGVYFVKVIRSEEVDSYKVIVE